LRLDDGCELGAGFYLGYKTDKELEEAKKLREEQDLQSQELGELQNKSPPSKIISDDKLSAAAQFLAKQRIPAEIPNVVPDVLNKIDEVEAQKEAAKASKEATKNISALFEQAKKLGKDLLGRKLSQLEESEEEREEWKESNEEKGNLKDWGPRVKPDPKTTHPQDVIYGLEHAYYGIIDRIDLKWSDPAILVFQQAYWMRSFVR
jgi:hypothetical protein